METVSVGIDTGSTFTDLVAVELERGRHHYRKVPTLTADPARGILDGIVELLDRNGLDRAAVKLLVLGTTPEERRLPAAGADIKLPHGSVLRIVTPAGGGYGERGSVTAARSNATYAKDASPRMRLASC